MSVSRETGLLSETGESQSHRAEAKRIARKIHEQAEQPPWRGTMSVSDGIALAQLHAILALIDALDEIRTAIGIVAAAR